MLVFYSSDQNVLKRWEDGLKGLSPFVIAGSASEINKHIKSGNADVVLLDCALPDMADLNNVIKIIHKYIEIDFMVMDVEPDDDRGFALVKAGVKGYCNRFIAPDLLNRAVESVRKGEVWVGRKLMLRLIEELSARKKALVKASQQLSQLSEREVEIAHMVGDGSSNKLIAQKLDITERTVKAHISSIFKKAGVNDRLQLALLMTSQDNE
ncbi:MAG: response regulator transcription factor [Gammaproteobacteria bacterium]|nr:response regulator transcription factor [Gammaproteobacteria bacterium]